LPVEVIGRMPQETSWFFFPVREQLGHFLLTLADRAADNVALYGDLPPLMGGLTLGSARPGATILAFCGTSSNPALVVGSYGKGRTATFAGDSTWHWLRLGQPESNLGLRAHARYWKQLIYWLAQKDDGTGLLEVDMKLGRDNRCVPAANAVVFGVHWGGQAGQLIDNSLEAWVETPRKGQEPVQVDRESGELRGVFTKTQDPGEYRVIVRGKGFDAEGRQVYGKGSKRFFVSPQAAARPVPVDSRFLTKLAQAGGGGIYTSQDLPVFLGDLLAERSPGHAERQK
jgi:hypothetical protein